MSNDPSHPTPLVLVLLDDQLLVFDDNYGKHGPQCVAQASKKKRCTNPAPPEMTGHQGWTSYFIRELGGFVSP